MTSPHLHSPCPNPHKRPRLSSSPHRQPYPNSYRTPQPSLTNLAHDRLASRAKLQTTWEDIIQKYSAIPSDEADEIDLDTGEVVVDHGHIKSLHRSVLWDPADSEPDDTDTIISDQAVNEPLPLGPFPAEGTEQKKLPSEDAIIKQFGEEFGRDILSYLQQRTQVPKTKPGKNEVWTAPAEEDAIFARATELWRRYCEIRPSPERPSRTFDKASFERAVFGMEVSPPTATSRSAFDEAVFGQQNVLDNDHDSDSDDWTETDEDEENVIVNNPAGLTTCVVDHGTLLDESPNKKRLQMETPGKLARTPSITSVTRPVRRGLSAKGRDESRGNVISGLIVAASDEEEDYLESSPAKSAKGRKRSVASISAVSPESSPDIKSGKRSIISISSAAPEPSMSSPNRSRTQHLRIQDDEEEDDDVTIEKGNDTKGRTCGDVGYRCTKAFCFTCVV